MIKIEKRSDLYREWARVLDMCEGTNVKTCDCVKTHIQKFSECPAFDAKDITIYQFAIAIVEDRPVFVGDELYFIDSGHKVTAISYNNNSKYIDYKYKSGDGCCPIASLTLTPPKPKTFNLNGVELPLPDAKIVRSNTGVSIVTSDNRYITSCFSIDFYGSEYQYENKSDRDKVAHTIRDLLQFN